MKLPVHLLVSDVAEYVLYTIYMSTLNYRNGLITSLRMSGIIATCLSLKTTGYVG